MNRLRRGAGRRHDVRLDVPARPEGGDEAVIPWIAVFRSVLMIPWNWMLCRVVSRRVPLPAAGDVVEGQVLLPGHLPAGNLQRTMNM